MPMPTIAASRCSTVEQSAPWPSPITVAKSVLRTAPGEALITRSGAPLWPGRENKMPELIPQEAGKLGIAYRHGPHGPSDRHAALKWSENSPASPPSGSLRSFRKRGENASKTSAEEPCPLTLPVAPPETGSKNAKNPSGCLWLARRYRGLRESQVTVFYHLLPKADAKPPPFRHLSEPQA
jgi:hypothetical protein